MHLLIKLVFCFMISFTLSSCNHRKHLSWASDIHLDSASSLQQKAFEEKLQKEKSAALLLSGDICEGTPLTEKLLHLSKVFKKPIFFVLGNHDFYGRSIEERRQEISTAIRNEENLFYLTELEGVIELSTEVALIGDDGCADGLCGDFLGSSIVLRDYVEINDLKNLEKTERMERLRLLGEEAVERLRPKLLAALEGYNKVILLMHAPPCREACLYNHEPAGDEWAPHFVCHSIGELVKKVMPDYPKKKLMIYAGHSHHAAHVHLLPNAEVFVAEAEYGEPQLQEGVIRL